jgi:hypothetical protein
LRTAEGGAVRGTGSTSHRRSQGCNRRHTQSGAHRSRRAAQAGRRPTRGRAAQHTQRHHKRVRTTEPRPAQKTLRTCPPQSRHRSPQQQTRQHRPLVLCLSLHLSHLRRLPRYPQLVRFFFLCGKNGEAASHVGREGPRVLVGGELEREQHRQQRVHAQQHREEG